MNPALRSPLSLISKEKTLSMKPNRTTLLRIFLPVVALLTAHNVVGYGASDGQQMFFKNGLPPTNASIGGVLANGRSRPVQPLYGRKSDLHSQGMKS